MIGFSDSCYSFTNEGQTANCSMTGNRRYTKSIHVGTVKIGGGAPVIVQSMTSTDTRDVAATVEQTKRLEEAGCEIVRVAVPDRIAAEALPEIKKRIRIPLIADIHFDYRLALLAVERGADALRINPGNTARDNLGAVIKKARERDVAIRIGINAGSLEKDILAKYGGPTASAMVESALRNVEFFENHGFEAIKLSLKSSDVRTMIEAYREIADKTPYPLHLGVTEAGGVMRSTIKSSVGLGVLLYEGIGDTVRVSITGDPVKEVSVAYGILGALDLRRFGPDIISCPTCGRCEIDLPALVEEVERRVAGMKEYVKIALMGCVVNGPGEAAEADIGIAGGRRQGLVFRKGVVVKKVKEDRLVDALMEELDAVIREKSSRSNGETNN